MRIPAVLRPRAKLTFGVCVIAFAGACLPPELTFDPGGGGGAGAQGGGGNTTSGLPSCPQCDAGRCDADGLCTTGDKVWAHRYGGPDAQRAESLAIETDGTIVLGGLTRGSVTFELPFEPAGGADAFLAWLSGGTGLAVESELFGDEVDQQINAVCIGGGRLHAAGSFMGEIPPEDENTGQTDAFWLNRTGTGFVNIVGLGSEGADDQQYGLAVAHPDLGGFTWVGGDFEGEIALALNLASTGRDAYLAFFDDDGELGGARHLRGAGDESVRALASVPGTDLVVGVGDFSLDVESDVCPFVLSRPCDGGFFVYSSDCSATRAFCVSAGSVVHARGVAVAIDASIWVTGYFEGTLDVGTGPMTSDGEDIFVVALDGSGTPTFAARYGGPGDDRGHAIAVDSSGSAIVAGQFDAAFTIGSFELDGSGDVDAFVFKLASGQALWAHAFTGAGQQAASAVAVDSDGAAVVTGLLEGTATFEGTDLESVGQEDIFVVKLAR